MTEAQAMRRVILPQAIRRMLPALTNRGIEIFKMSTLASAVAYVELLQQGKLFASLNFNPIEAYTVIAVVFFACLYPWCGRPMRWSGAGPIGRMTMTEATRRWRAPAASAQPLMRVAGLQKRFGEHEVLRGIDLVVKPGERVANLGASGSGKSTLLRCLNFMERPSAGLVELAGETIGGAARGKAVPTATYNEAELTQVRQRVGMVFQQFNLFPHMTAMGNVMEGLRTVRWTARSRARAGARATGPGGPGRQGRRLSGALSGGQKQRVAIARALAMEPEVLLFDEPTSALDPELVGEVLSVIRALAVEGRTMLLVTHEIGFAYHVADRILFIVDGVIHEQGTPDEVLKYPSQPGPRPSCERHREFDFLAFATRTRDRPP